MSSGLSDGDSESLDLESDVGRELLAIAAPVRSRPKPPAREVEATIVALCERRWLGLKDLAVLLDRNPDSLRRSYLRKMVDDGQLNYRYPNSPNHSRQAYRAASAGEKDEHDA